MVREEMGVHVAGMDWYVSLSLRFQRKLRCSVNATALLLTACKEEIRDSAAKIVWCVLARNRCCPAKYASEHCPVTTSLFPRRVVEVGERREKTNRANQPNALSRSCLF